MSSAELTSADGMVADMPSEATQSRTNSGRVMNPMMNAYSDRVWSEPEFARTAVYAPHLGMVGAPPTSIPAPVGIPEESFLTRTGVRSAEARFASSLGAPGAGSRVVREPVTEVRPSVPVMMSDLRRSQAMVSHREVMNRAYQSTA